MATGQARAGGRNPAIDWLKGVLTILVMLGHLSGTGVNFSPFKWTLYGFHMPVFMALSGYLLNVEKLRGGGIGPLCRRYWSRMILPWLILFVALLPVYGDAHSWHGVVRWALWPWNHLWFVPALFVLILVAVAVPLSRFWLMLVSLPVGLGAWFAVQVFGVSFSVFPIDIRYFTMAPFLFFGLWLRTSGIAVPGWLWGVFLAALAAYGALYGAQHSLWLLIVYPALGFSGVALIGWIERMPLRSRFLEVLGAESLFVYLYHPLLFNVARGTVYRWMDLNLAYAVTLVVTLALLFGLRAGIRRVSWLALLTGVVPA